MTRFKESTELTTGRTGIFSPADVGKKVTVTGDARPHTLVRVSMYGATMVPRRWWHRYRLLRWMFL